jgi:hypothetical protein
VICAALRNPYATKLVHCGGIDGSRAASEFGALFSMHCQACCLNVSGFTPRTLAILTRSATDFAPRPSGGACKGGARLRMVRGCLDACCEGVCCGPSVHPGYFACWTPGRRAQSATSCRSAARAPRTATLPGPDKRDERATPHSRTSLARATNTSDKETPSDAAVLRLTAM